jgi:hypothetical protein
MTATAPDTARAALAAALGKVHRCEPLTEEEERLVKASMPVLASEDFEAGDEVDPDVFLADPGAAA